MTASASSGTARSSPSTVEGLRDAAGTEMTLRVTVDEVTPAVRGAVADLDGVSAVEVEGSTLVVSCRGDVKTDVLTAVEDAGGEVRDFSTEEASLEELFAAYTTEEVPA